MRRLSILGQKNTIIILMLLLLGIPATIFALQKGDFPPTLSGTTLEGHEFSIDSLRGLPILLKVGTTWCPTCNTQAEEINKLRGFMTEKGIQFIEVFIQESGKRVVQYLNKNGHQAPDAVIMDQGKIARALNVYLIPRLILINKDFKVYRDGKPLASEALQLEMQKMLAE